MTRRLSLNPNLSYVIANLAADRNGLNSVAALLDIDGDRRAPSNNNILDRSSSRSRMAGPTSVEDELMPYLQEDFMDVLVGIQNVLETLRECLVQNHTLPQRYYPITERTGERPRYVIPCDQICQLRETGMSWRAIAALLSVSERTLRRHRLRIGLPRDRYSDISNDNLDRMIHNILSLTPESGETYMQGSLRGKCKVCEKFC